MFCLDKQKSLILNTMTIINIITISFHVLLHEILLGIQYSYFIYKLKDHILTPSVSSRTEFYMAGNIFFNCNS
jgi:hypothetical protein